MFDKNEMKLLLVAIRERLSDLENTQIDLQNDGFGSIDEELCDVEDLLIKYEVLYQKINNILETK